MRAVVITHPGGPEVMELRDVPDPVPGDGEALVRVTAAGVNRADLLQRQGLYPPPPGASPYPGMECSGVVAALGADVTGWQVGGEVCALLAGGGYAELVAVPAGQLLPVPPGVSVTDAAALPEVACTVHDAIVRQACLAPGETLLVHGGGGGIGTMAIQLGKALGATVVATTGSAEKQRRCAELGADLAVSYREDDFVAAVRDFTGGSGADVILDIMGAAYLPRNVAALAAGGRLVVIATRGGPRAELDVGALLRARGRILASTLRGRPLAEKARVVEGVREEVWPLVAAGHVRPVVDRRLPMADAPAAHRILSEGEHVGKVLLLS